ncbi:hypothetical protein HAX54_046780 [Datura stramonium]|uniref:Protein kinase domain-containing protein n=1 Tax=Datura stramonium TaxID=4076 RepID=A0ABS8WJN4_DATST|nr:hypothetical protein [Datura stramonium]
MACCYIWVHTLDQGLNSGLVSCRALPLFCQLEHSLSAESKALNSYDCIKNLTWRQSYCSTCLSKCRFNCKKIKPRWTLIYMIDDLCNKKQVDLISLVSKEVLSEEEFWSWTSIAKYCAKRLPTTTEVMAIDNGKVFFRRTSTSQLKGSFDDPKPSLNLERNSTSRDCQSEFGESDVSEMGRFSCEVTRTLDRWTNEKLIGKGGGNSVYKALLSDGKSVAVKVSNSSEESRKDFRQEMDIMTRVKHKNIAHLLGICMRILI